MAQPSLRYMPTFFVCAASTLPCALPEMCLLLSSLSSPISPSLPPSLRPPFHDAAHVSTLCLEGGVELPAPSLAPHSDPFLCLCHHRSLRSPDVLSCPAPPPPPPRALPPPDLPHSIATLLSWYHATAAPAAIAMAAQPRSRAPSTGPPPPRSLLPAFHVTFDLPPRAEPSTC